MENNFVLKSKKREKIALPPILYSAINEFWLRSFFLGAVALLAFAFRVAFTLFAARLPGLITGAMALTRVASCKEAHTNKKCS